MGAPANNPKKFDPTAEMSTFQKLMFNVFPKMPDFYALLDEQLALVEESAANFVAFMEKNDKQKGEAVCEVEHKGDELKNRNLAILNWAFSTPLDREDFNRAITTIDMVMNYAKTTVREMEILGVGTDQYTLEMARLMQTGAQNLRKGYANSKTNRPEAEAAAAAVLKAEREIEKVYRRAIADLFTAEENLRNLASHTANSKTEAVKAIIEMFKRREIYRHMSNAGDELAKAGGVLNDILIQDH